MGKSYQTNSPSTPPELSHRAREAYRSPDNDVFLSSVSTWEIAIKHSLGRLPLPELPETYIPALRQKLVCQAIVGGMVLLTPDESITGYPIRSVW